MVEPNVIESFGEEFAERYFKNGFEGFTEKYGKDLADLIKIAFCDGYVAGSCDIIRRVKKQFDELTTHTHGGYRGQ